LSKLVLDFKVPAAYDRQSLADIIRVICNQVNSLSESKITGKYNAMSSVPSGTAVAYQTGDFVPNSNCTLLGTVGAQYIIEGWTCVAPGTPGTFVEKRFITGT
jgi:hypothetical protein